MAQHLSRSHVLAGTGAMLAAMARPAHAQAVPKLRLICVPGEGNSPVLYGIRAGMYRRAGIDVEIVPTGSGTTATTAVIGGAYELAGGSVIAALAAHLRNIPIALVCNAGLWDAKSPISYAVVAADSSLHTGADVNGKTGGVAGLNDIIVVGMLAWIDKNGGDSSTVKWVEMPNSAQGPAVIEHRIDFAALTEPNYTANMESGKLRMFAVPLDAIADRFAISGYYARRDWAQNNQQVVRTFTW